MSGRAPEQPLTAATATIRATGELAPGVRSLWLEIPEIAREAVPGQFVMVEGGPGRSTRRPFSVCGVDGERGLLRLAVRQAGPASTWLASRPVGTGLALHGPLGQGFVPPTPGREVWLVGGGIGVAPLLFLASALRAKGLSVWAAVGGRSAADTWGAGELRRLGAEAEVATEDGSRGERGLVTTLVEGRLQREESRPSVVYACGPRGMLGAVAALVAQAGLSCQVSVEERMACGVGACAGCTWPAGRLAPGLTLRPVGTAGSTPGEGEGSRPLRVCRDGPCFEVVAG